MTEQPNGRASEDLRDDEMGTPEEERSDTDARAEEGVVPEGAVSDTTAVKDGDSIGRPASTMRA